jgi:hypothetical protein
MSESVGFGAPCASVNNDGPRRSTMGDELEGGLAAAGAGDMTQLVDAI